MKEYIKIFFNAGHNIILNDGVEHAGYMSFMNILSLFPFLVFIVALAGFIGETRYAIDFLNIIMTNLPDSLTDALKPRMNEIMSGPPHGLLTLSILGAIWTASSSVEGLRTILNKIYHVKTPPAYILRRLLSILQFLALTTFIIFSMFLLVLIPIIYEKLSYLLQIQSLTKIDYIINLDFFTPVWSYFRTIVLTAVLFFVVSTLYYIIPNVKLSYKSVVPGSLLVVICWLIIGKFLAAYIGNYKQVSIIYGSLGGVIISMLFFFIINIVLIYGAEVNFLLRKDKLIPK